MSHIYQLGILEISRVTVALAAFVAALAVGVFGAQVAMAYPTEGSEATSLGKVTVGADVSEWNVGSGQINGEFVVAELQGVQLGLRSQERFVGPLQVTGDQGNRVGVYEATTGDTGGDNNGTWNYDFHVDLSNAKGNAEGKVLTDYRLVLEQDFTDENLFGVLGNDPVELPLGDETLGQGVCSGGTFTTTLCQQSWNPGFGNTDYDPNAERTYNLRVVLIPETFSGPPIAAAIRVNVTNPS